MITAPHLHAMVIHFPIALLMASFLSEIISLFVKISFFKNATVYLLLLGTLGAIVAYVSGSYAGDGMTDGLLQEPMELHEDAALVTLWIAIIVTVYKTLTLVYDYHKPWSQWFSIFLFSLLIGFLTKTAYLGGQLVFKHGAGIELALPDFGEQPK
jgi:uncharacterized membrane protein